MNNPYARFLPGLQNTIGGPQIPAAPMAHFSSPGAGFAANSSAPAQQQQSNPFQQFTNSAATQGIKQLINPAKDAGAIPFNGVTNASTLSGAGIVAPPGQTLGGLPATATPSFTSVSPNMPGGISGAMRAAGNPMTPTTGADGVTTINSPFMSSNPFTSVAQPSQFTQFNSAPTYSMDTGNALDSAMFQHAGIDAGADLGAGAGGAEMGATGAEAGSAGAAGAEAGAAGAETGAATGAASSGTPWGLIAAAALMADSHTGGHVVQGALTPLQQGPGAMGDTNWWADSTGYNSLFGSGGLFG